MAFSPTEEQALAIATRDRSLLVSAAAGSGKTATLTRRIIASLLDAEHPADLDALLIVTFTNAAVEELRARIADALRSALLDEPTDARLRRQLLLLPAAHICTIDSFCNDILRECAATVGLDAGYRIADSAEAMLLSDRVMESLLEGVYRGEYADRGIEGAEFAAVCDCFFDVKSMDKLSSVLLTLYRKTETHERGVFSLSDLCEEYHRPSGTPPHKTRFGRYGIECLHALCRHYAQAFVCLGEKAQTLAGDSRPLLSLLAQSREEVSFLQALEKLSDYEEVRTFLAAHEHPRLPVMRAGEDEMAPIRDLLKTREQYKKDLSQIRDNFFTYTTGEYEDLYKELYKKTTILAKFMENFHRSYREEKRRAGICEYSDLERYAYECLWKDGRRTPYAEEVATRFEAVYIDEYQDVNRLQNRIFEAVSRPHNRFMVGDIKQSIYSFRSADPGIFAEMKRTYPPLDPLREQTEASMFLRDNFRCDKPIVDFVNHVFDRIFGLVGESVGYVDADRLRFAKPGAGGGHDPALLIAISADATAHTGAQAQEQSQSAKHTEARMVAEHVRALLRDGMKDDGTPVRPGDIAILMRNRKANAAVFAAALREAGIPCEVPEERDFFLSPEILLALCLLNTIDNPGRDIYLAGVLLSPLEGFTPDELYRFRTAGGRTLYESMCAYVRAHPDYRRGADFLSRLERERTVAENISVGALLERLLTRTALLAVCSRNGGGDNLLLLTEYARRFEGGGFSGLYRFIHYINNLIERATTFERAATTHTGADAVHLMSVHASKGLEFPVCYLVGCAGLIADRESGASLAFAEDFGLAFRLFEPGGLCQVENPVVYAISHYRRARMYEEEMRVLYVALTRARERLYISGVVRCDPQQWSADAQLRCRTLSTYSARRMKSYLEVLSLSAVQPQFFTDTCDTTPVDPDCTAAADTVSAQVSSCSDSDGKEELSRADSAACRTRDTLLRRFSFSYPDRILCGIPEKLSVSFLSPSVLDGTQEGEDVESLSLDNESDLKIEVGILPSFLTGKEDDESKRRGVSTHKFMQFCDFAYLAENGVEAEIIRLLSQGFLTARDGERVRREEIMLFTQSELFVRLRAAKKIWREFRFHVELPAALFTRDPQRRDALGERTLLVQGVMDCVMRESDGSLSLVDYKTDRIPSAYREDIAGARRLLRDRHAAQLGYYRLAAERIFGTLPTRTEIYSLALGSCIALKE